VRARAGRIARALEEAAGAAVQAEVVEGASMVGGGSAPGLEIPTALLALRPARGSVADYERALRTGRDPVIARVAEGRLLIDPRTVAEEEETRLVAALGAAIPRG
jgi:L-seryl-tRNA(Ser) seleniumtransferase